jgi:hypothetical protein
MCYGSSKDVFLFQMLMQPVLVLGYSDTGF